MPSKLIFVKEKYKLFANTINEVGRCMSKNDNIEDDTLQYYQQRSRMELAQDIMGFFLDVLRNALTDDLILLDRPIYIY